MEVLIKILPKSYSMLIFMPYTEINSRYLLLELKRLLLLDFNIECKSVFYFLKHVIFLSLYESKFCLFETGIALAVLNSLCRSGWP